MPTPSQPRRVSPNSRQLADHRTRKIDRHGKADAQRAAAARDDRRIDADDLAVHIEQRAAGIALVDGGVGLEMNWS